MVAALISVYRILTKTTPRAPIACACARRKPNLPALSTAPLSIVNALMVSGLITRVETVRDKVWACSAVYMQTVRDGVSAFEGKLGCLCDGFWCARCRCTVPGVTSVSLTGVSVTAVIVTDAGVMGCGGKDA